MHVMIREKSTGAEDWVPLERAAELLGLTADELEVVLAEHGECEGTDYIALDQDW